MQHYTVYFIWKLLCMFRVVPSPIIRSSNKCIYSIWYLRHPQHTQTSSNSSRWQQIAITVWQIPYAVDTVVWAPDDGWWYHPKHVEQFPDKINCVMLHLVGYTECPRRKGQNFGRVFLMLKYTDITQNTYIQSWTVTEIMAREKCGLLVGPRTVPVNCQVLSMFVLESGVRLRKVRSH